jgi:hypothetical protein
MKQKQTRPSGRLEACFQDMHPQPVDVVDESRADARRQYLGIEFGNFVHGLGPGSNSTTEGPRLAREQAEAQPAMPPPTMATS